MQCWKWYRMVEIRYWRPIWGNKARSQFQASMRSRSIHLHTPHRIPQLIVNGGWLRPYVTQGDEVGRGRESQPDGATLTLAVSASSWPLPLAYCSPSPSSPPPRSPNNRLVIFLCCTLCWFYYLVQVFYSTTSTCFSCKLNSFVVRLVSLAPLTLQNKLSKKIRCESKSDWFPRLG